MKVFVPLVTLVIGVVIGLMWGLGINTVDKVGDKSSWDWYWQLTYNPSFIGSLAVMGSCSYLVCGQNREKINS